jgi:hypothetical protein
VEDVPGVSRPRRQAGPGALVARLGIPTGTFAGMRDPESNTVVLEAEKVSLGGSIVKTAAVYKSALMMGALLAVAGALQRPLSSAARKTGAMDASAPLQETAMPKPGPEMDRVKFLIGTWDLKTEYLKSKMVPSGGKGHGWYKAQRGPGGFSLIADFEEDGPEGREQGHQVFSWDPQKNWYTVVTVGNSFPGAVIGHARWEGDNLVTEAEMVTGGMNFSERAVYSNVSENSVHIEESVKLGDAPFAPMYRVDAVKK